MPAPNITYNLIKLRDLLVSRGTCRQIPLDLAYIIQAVDSKNEYCYVEMPTHTEECAQLWHITDWRDCSAHREHLKYESELYRQRSYATQRNLERLVAAYRNLTGMDKEMATEQCLKILQSSFCEKTFQTLKVKYEVVIGLDRSLLTPIISVHNV